MKMTELRQVSEDKIGRVNKNNVDIELHEDSTILYLTQYGFNVEVVKPTNAYRTNSADIFMMGAVWEMKSPTSFKESTIKEDFRKAKEQSDRIVFDLRRVKKYADDVENIY